MKEGVDLSAIGAEAGSVFKTVIQNSDIPGIAKVLEKSWEKAVQV